jgi:glycosyltransferase involved in cell wall biosynthesis
MMEQALVSVLMTAYNREKYITQAIRSVLDSTYTNFELIVVDDGSKDNTVAIARQLALADNRIKVYINETNLGDYPNRNKAASYANGKYLKYVDADDLIYPWALEILVSCMEYFPEAAYGLCSMPQDNDRIFPFQLTPEQAYRRHYSGKGVFDRAPLSSIIRREQFNAVNGFSPVRMVGDFEMWHKLSMHYPVVLMPQGMIWYRKHEQQEMSLHKNFEFNYNRISFDYLANEKCPLPPEEKREILGTIKKRVSRRLLSCLAQADLQNYNKGRKIMQYSFLPILKNAFA